jgi:hypothetical protein
VTFWAPIPKDIRQKSTALLDTVRTTPVPMRTELGCGVLDITLLCPTLFASLYSPYTTFPTIAQGLAELATGSGKRLFDMSNPLETAWRSMRDSALAVMCNDGDEVPDDLKLCLAFKQVAKK